MDRQTDKHTDSRKQYLLCSVSLAHK